MSTEKNIAKQYLDEFFNVRGWLLCWSCRTIQHYNARNASHSRIYLPSHFYIGYLRNVSRHWNSASSLCSLVSQSVSSIYIYNCQHYCISIHLNGGVHQSLKFKLRFLSLFSLHVLVSFSSIAFVCDLA